MKIIPVLAVAVSLCAAAAGAQSLDGTTTILCLDVSGRSLPAACQISGGRLDAREDICSCPLGGTRVITPICPAGVKAPAESAAYERARYAASRSGSLVGATYKGKPMCRAPRNVTGGG